MALFGNLSRFQAHICVVLYNILYKTTNNIYRYYIYIYNINVMKLLFELLHTIDLYLIVYILLLLLVNVYCGMLLLLFSWYA